MLQIELRNDFHGSRVRLRVPRLPYLLSRGQVRRAERELCGVVGCRCGEKCGTRGPQDYKLSFGPDFIRVWVEAMS